MEVLSFFGAVLRCCVVLRCILLYLFARFWRVNLVKDVPLAALKMSLYEGSMKVYAALTETTTDRLSPSERAIIGFVAGASSALFICPIDVINTHIKAKLVKDMGIRECAVHIAKTKGLMTFYRGAVPSMLSLGIGSSVFWGIHAHVGRLLFTAAPGDVSS